MKRLLPLLVATVLFLAAGTAVAVPEIPEGFTLQGGGPIDCGDKVVLKYVYAHPDGSVIVTFKEPNRPARAMLRWHPGSDGPADEAYIGYGDPGERVSFSELLSRYPRACDLFKGAEA